LIIVDNNKLNIKERVNKSYYVIGIVIQTARLLYQIARIDMNVILKMPSVIVQKPVLQGLSLVVKPGETLALVGASGGGKSSVVKLIERFYVPEEGSIKLDGHDLQAFDRRWLMRHMAFVGQEPVLYARSIARNILFGLEEADGYHETPSAEEVPYCPYLLARSQATQRVS
jgi:ABC-type multidrug transport system fused ATPase/permease subunit